MTAAADPRIAPARLFGRLLLRELDRDGLAELSEPAIRSALAELGVELPGAGELDALAAEFFAMVLQPTKSSPLVQSLWQQGKYDGDAAVAVRQIAAASGLVPGGGARRAPVDHIGCLLSLWAELREQGSELAAPFARDHLAWIARSSAPSAPPDRFYGAVLRAAAELVVEIVGEANN